MFSARESGNGFTNKWRAPVICMFFRLWLVVTPPPMSTSCACCALAEEGSARDMSVLNISALRGLERWIVGLGCGTPMHPATPPLVWRRRPEHGIMFMAPDLVAGSCL